MSCEQPQIPPAEAEYPDALVPPAAGEATLVDEPGTKAALTARRDCDARTAVKRGLRQYLEQLSVDVEGTTFRFQRVHEVWSDVEEHAVFPSALVETLDDGDYDRGFTPQLDPDDRLPDGTWLVRHAELAQRVRITVYGSSPEERVAAMMLLEDAIGPVTWMQGFILQLPFYFNARAVYEPTAGSITDTGDAAGRRWREGAVVLNAQLNVYRPRALPAMDVRTNVVVESP